MTLRRRWLVAIAALAQRRFGDFDGFGYGRMPPIHNVPYDGQFTFVRVKYETAPGGYWAGGRPSWVHGYPLAEQNLMRIMNEVSFLDARTDEINVLSLDDPGAVQVPDRLHHRGRLVDADRSRGRRAARLHPEGRLRHRRRLQDARLARRRHAAAGSRSRRT